MAQFRYTARSKEGKTLSSVLTAPDQRQALDQLKRMNVIVVNLSEVAGSQSLTERLKAMLASLSGKGKKPRSHLKQDDFCVFTRQIATMVASGIPLLESLEILSEQAEDKGFKAILEEIVSDIRSGLDLSASMSRHPKVFSHIYVSMVKAGEASGKLDDILVRLAEYLEGAAELKREIRAAMTYPVISMVMVVGIAVFLLVGIVPKFEEMFKSFGANLPTLTQIVMDVSMTMKEHFVLVGLAFVAVAVGLFVYITRFPKGRRNWDWFRLRAPIAGPLVHKIVLSRFSKTFGTLIQSGVPILGALEIVQEVLGNVLIEEDVAKAREAVRQGEQLATPLGKSKMFPPMVVKMIAVGERTGALEKLLEKISEFYDQQVRATVKSLTSIIEPVMIGVMGLFVGIIVVAIFYPLMQAPQLMKKGAGGGAH